MGIKIEDWNRLNAKQQVKAIKEPELESMLHALIREYCKDQWPRWKYIEGRMDRRSTIAVGAQDFTIFMPDKKVLCVECKRKGCKPDKEQLSWHKEMSMLGHTVYVVHDMAEFLSILRDKP